MRVCRLISCVDLASRQNARRSVSLNEKTRLKRGGLRSWRSGAASRAYSRGVVSRINQRPQLRYSVVHSSESENQTVVDEEAEESSDEAESEKNGEVTQADEAYSGPAAEILKELREADSDLADDLVPRLEEVLQCLAQDKSSAEDQCSASEAELEETKSKYLRLTADFDNFRKRAVNEKEQLRNSAKGEVIESLLPLVDNFELARTQVKPQNESEEAIVTSFMGLYRQMVELFSQLGVEAIECDQKPFDPEFHDAIMRELNNDLEDGTVTEELRKGFTMKGKLLRPAMVKVSYSDEVLQETELPMEETESTIELEKDDETEASLDGSE